MKRFNWNYSLALAFKRLLFTNTKHFFKVKLFGLNSDCDKYIKDTYMLM